MELNGTGHKQGTHLAGLGPWSARRAISIVSAAGFGAALALSVSHGVGAQDPESMSRNHGGACDNATLRGSYGRLGSGFRVAPANPALIESFVATGRRTYDGHGTFTEITSSHGTISPPNRDTPATGTYKVNPDCTGTTILLITGVPFPIETSFVIVDRGEQVNHAILSPPPQVASAIERRIR